LDQHVHSFEWSDPETGEAGGWTFSEINFKASQSLRLRVPDVPIDGKKYDVELFMAYTVRGCLRGGRRRVAEERRGQQTGATGLHRGGSLATKRPRQYQVLDP
jgi:hypothetical protein